MPEVHRAYQALGFESSLVAAVVLAVCLRELLERPGSLSALLVCASSLVVMGHTWQLLLPVTGIAEAENLQRRQTQRQGRQIGVIACHAFGVARQWLEPRKAAPPDARNFRVL